MAMLAGDGACAGAKRLPFPSACFWLLQGLRVVSRFGKQCERALIPIALEFLEHIGPDVGGCAPFQIAQAELVFSPSRGRVI